MHPKPIPATYTTSQRNVMCTCVMCVLAILVPFRQMFVSLDDYLSFSTACIKALLNYRYTRH